MTMNKSATNARVLLSSLILSSALGGCATTQTAPGEIDPWDGWNRGTQEFNDNLDKAIIKPLAEGYRWITPKFVDDGITNFFSNINDIGVTLNDFMQFKLAQGGMDAGRFLINTTAGVGGFIDVAKMIDLPKHDEDFGQTLGYWGVPSGSYFVLPFFGPSSPRGIVGLIGDALMNPLTYTFVLAGSGAAVSAINGGSKAVDVTDTRADMIPTEKIMDEAAVDRYNFIKNAYLQRRNYLIHDGNVPEEDDPLLEANGENGNGTTETTSKADTSVPSHEPDTAPAANSTGKHFLDISAPDGH